MQFPCGHFVLALAVVACGGAGDGARASETGRSVQTDSARRATACFPFGPDTVQLTGVVRRTTYPGPPNFERVASGDEPESIFVLELEAPVCAAGGRDQELGDSARGVDLVQLLTDSAGYAELERGATEPTTLRGTLFPAHTAHHRTPILLDVVYASTSRVP
jgi:Domain of unknown function (DUF4431)